MQCQPCKTDDETLDRKGVLKGKTTELWRKQPPLQRLHKPTDECHSKTVLFSDALSLWVAEMLRGAGSATVTCSASNSNKQPGLGFNEFPVYSDH